MKDRNHQFRVKCLIYAGLGLITLRLYLPLLHHGFLAYDDQQYVTDNPRVQAGLTWAGLVWAFGFHAGNWHPLAWLSHMLDCQLYGARAGGHHLTSVLLHVASTLLLFSVLNRMMNLRRDDPPPLVNPSSREAKQPANAALTAAVPEAGAMWRSAAVAALFAWHPLHVESVAWVAERKDVLCAFFWMLTFSLYVHYAARPTTARYLFTLGSFVLCLMSKPMGVTLPFVLLLLDYWPLKRFTIDDLPVLRSNTAEGGRLTIFRLVWEKIPFLILSLVGCVLTLRAQEVAIVSTAGLSVAKRVAHVSVAYNHYLATMFVPRNLAVYYPYQLHLPDASIACAVVVLGLITVLATANLRRRPYLMVGWLWYLGTLVPVIGLVQVGDQAWADRYTYLPSVGLFVAVVWFAAEIIKSRLVLQIASALVAAAMLAMTSAQISYWKDTRTLFEHAREVTPRNYMAITMLGSLLANEHKYDEAIAYYHLALHYQPAFPEAHFYLGAALDEQGKLDEALAEYQKALWFKPTQEQTHIFMGMALGKQKKYDEAIAHYTAALKLNPDSAVAENNLARIYHSQGRLDAAIEHYRAALEIDPKLALAHNNLGILLIQKDQLADGTRQLREALQLDPTNSETRLNLGFALNQQNQWSEAVGLFTNVVRNDLPDPRAHYEFAVALAHVHKTREARSQYASALLLQPDFPDALDGLAWILSTDTNRDFRNGAEAVKMAWRACELTGSKDPAKLKTLAAAYAETGRFAEAINTLQSAKDLAAKANRPELVNQCTLMLDHFQKSEPWRER